MSKYAAPRKKHPVLLFFMILLLAMAVSVVFAANWLNNEISGRGDGTTVTVEIPKGASTVTVAELLKEHSVVDSAFIFRAYTRYVAEADGAFQYGSFELPRHGSYTDIIAALTTTSSHRDSVTVTFPEGYNAYQMGKVLEDAGLCTAEDFLEVVNNESFTAQEVSFWDEISKDTLKLIRLDGFLFPDTYQFFKDATPREIVLTLLNTFKSKAMTEQNMELLEQSGLSLEEWVIFASIIQRESANVTEMYNVSSVFFNRLQPNSPIERLESCTTNNYINDYLQPAFSGSAPQEILTAYDTYDRAGFPIGAIANPGLDALDAALKPNDTPYYFFCTDIEYTHYYGKTWQEHLDNIERAKQVNRKYGKEGL